MIIGDKAEHVLLFLADLQHSKVEIVKTGYNKFGKYEYATKDDILRAINPYLKTHSCIVMWSEEGHEHERQYKETEKGITYWLYTDCLVKCRIQWVGCIDDYVEGTSHGYGVNANQDKTLKAHTIAERYALTGLLGIPSVSEEDTDASHSDVKGQEATIGHTTPVVQKAFHERMTKSSESLAERTKRRCAASVETKRNSSNLLM